MTNLDMMVLASERFRLGQRVKPSKRAILLQARYRHWKNNWSHSVTKGIYHGVPHESHGNVCQVGQWDNGQGESRVLGSKGGRMSFIQGFWTVLEVEAIIISMVATPAVVGTLLKYILNLFERDK